MKTLYACEFCKTAYEDKQEAMRCEFSHLKLFLNDPCSLNVFCESYLDKSICDFCENVYYVYGCESNCQKKECQMNRDRPDFVLNKDKFEKEIKDFKKLYDL